MAVGCPVSRAGIPDKTAVHIAGKETHQFSIRPDDPGIAEQDITLITTMDRPGWRVRTEVHARIACSADAFTVQARLQALEGEAIKLMFQDEAHFGRISDERRRWAPKPLRPLCQAILTREYTYAYGAVDVCTGELDSLIAPHVNTECMQLFLNEVSARHPDARIVIVIEGAGWHRSDALKAPANIYLLKLPPYPP